MDGFETDRYMLDNQLYEGQQYSGEGSVGDESFRGSGGGGGVHFGCLDSITFGLAAVAIWILIFFCSLVGLFIVCALLNMLLGFEVISGEAFGSVVFIASVVIASVVVYSKLHV